MMRVRPANDADVAAIAALAATHRRRLAEWAPRWWGAAPGADAIHPLWLGHLVQADGPVARVVEDDGEVVAFAVSLAQPGQWFVDDVVVAEGRWDDAGAALLAAVTERPALTCVAVADGVRIAAMHEHRLVPVSTYWIGPPAGDHVAAAPSPALVTPIPRDAEVPPPAPHTFGGGLDPAADGALAFATPDGGLLVGSPSLSAPPIYGSGGTVTVIDRVTGAHRALLLDRAFAAAGERGDVLVAVVVATGDDGLAALVAERGCQPTVAVLRWP